MISFLYVRHKPGKKDPPPDTRAVRVQKARSLYRRDAADYVRVLHRRDVDVDSAGNDGKQRHCQDR